MGKLPFIAAVVSAMWVVPASAGDAIPSKPEVALAQLDLCVGLTAVTETVITIATTTIGPLGTLTIGAIIEAESVVT